MERLHRKISLILIFSLVLTMFTPAFTYAEAENSDKTVLYVDQAKGKDSGTGDINSPLKTIQRAQYVVKTLPKNKPIEVIISSGVYPALSFTEQDSGTKEAPITYKAAEGAEVVISGAKKVDLSGFTKVTDPKVVSRIQDQVYPYIGQINLLEYGFTKQELDMINEQANAYYIEPVRRPVPLTVMFNGVAQTIAEYPNNGEYLKVVNVTVPGAQGSGQSYEHWVDDGTRSTFKYTDARIEKWTQAKDIFVDGYIGVDWGLDSNFVKEINTKEGTLTFSEPVNYTLKDGDRIHFMNFVEELDLPGEWVIDQETYIMYYYPPYKVNPEKDTLEIVTSTIPLIDFQKTNYVTIEGFTLKNNKGYGVNIVTGDNVNIRKCIIRNMATSAIFVKGKECTMEGNQIMYTGSEGIVVSGEHIWDGTTDYRADISKPNSIKVLNNYFYDTYPALIVRHKNNVGFQFRNNLIHGNRDYLGILYQGVECDVSYNEIANVLREVGDLGPIYTGREMSDFGSVVSYNYVHDYGADYESDESISGIYWDDYQCGQTGINNILVPNNTHLTRATHLASGSHNTLKYNITVNSESGIMARDRNEYSGIDTTDFTKQESYTNGRSHLTQSIIDKYPQVLEAFEYIDNHPTHAHAPLKNVITDNFTVNVKTNSDPISQAIIDLGTVENNTVVENGADLTEIFVDPDNHDFRIKREAMEKYNLAEEFINEDNFDMESIGIQNDILDMTDKKGDFRLFYPANGAVNVPSTNVTIKWEQADHADYYTYELAKDAEFTEIVAEGRAPYPSFNLGKLKNGESYYWRVKAYNITREMEKEWDCTGGPYLFTIADSDKTDKSLLKKTIDAVSPIFEAEYTESNNVGEYKIGTTQALQKILADAMQIYGNTASTQEQIDGMTTKLSDVAKSLDGYKNTGYKTIDLSGKDAFTSEDANFTATYKDNSVVLGGTDSTVTYKEKVPGYNVMKFRMYPTFDAGNGWYGFALKRSLPTGAIWTGVTYLIVVKKNIIEFQKYNAAASKTGILLEVENKVVKPNQWYEMEIGAVETPEGVYAFAKANGEELFSYFDNENPIRGDGYFCIKPLSTGTLEIAPTQDDISGLYTVPEDLMVSTEQEIEGTVYSYNSSELTKNGEFEQSDTLGYEDEKIYVAEQGSMKYKIIASGNHTLRYYHVPIEGGDENVNIAVTYSDAAASHTINRCVNLSKGEAGWVNLGTYNLRGYGGSAAVEVTVEGSGKGLVTVPQIMLSKASYEELEFSSLFYTKAENLLALKIGSNIAFDRSNKLKLPDAVPEIVGDRTYVPLRFVSEVLGAEVKYNEATNTAEITVGDKAIAVTPSNNYIVVNDEKITLDSGVFEKDGRMFVPLRAISEAMEKAVLWNDTHSIILIADKLEITENDTDSFEKFEAQFTK